MVPLSSHATLPQALSLVVSTGLLTLIVALRNRMDELGDGERDIRGELLSSIGRPDLSRELAEGDSRGVWRLCVGDEEAIAEGSDTSEISYADW